MNNAWRAFWEWYDRTYTLNVSIALGLFLLQLIHLIWLFGAVVWARAFGAPLFEFTGIWQTIIVLVDYTEVPALFSVSLIYINTLRKGWENKSAFFLFALVIQLLHIYWITDEFVVETFVGGVHTTNLPAWLAWVAILIDYLEVPVMLDAFRRFAVSMRERRVGEFLKHDLRE